MTDPRRSSGSKVSGPPNPQEEPAPKHGARTEGTNRDFDESGESENQKHGHPREERGEVDEAR